MKRVCLVLVLCAVMKNSFAQDDKRRGTLYFGGGFNRSFYTGSDIRLKSAARNFDFTLENVRASDDGKIKFSGGSATQYSYIVGYYFRRKNFGVEFNFDHLKYFVKPGQVVRAKGEINGLPIQKDTALTPGFFQLEHSDGANYAMINFVKLRPLASLPNKRNSLDLVLKAGAGIVIPKTNSTVLGVHYDEAYVLSGYVLGVEGGVRFGFLRYGFLSGTFKGAYANYHKFRIAEGRGSQQWVSGQFNLIAGAQFPL